MFHFEKNEESRVPLWMQLRNRLVYLINSGHYQPGDQLPTIHEMAIDLSINYNTVSKVYTSLANDGYITSKRGVGAFVNGFDAGESREQADAIEQALDECIAALTDIGLSNRDIEAAMRTRVRKLEQEAGTYPSHE
ncbi:GntR family transcriptional regulator [Eggerthella guodeyinii]|uniref:GntR family transcriptional regulator n=2 Tax=Eggerthella TaxID=84111 RepID=A0A6N7RJQ3_9ACTN|nr:GntR family transcriptional regulator [Eggerthella guodeyinii]MBC5585587.1 GntR family transcriptional regulator [Eggerthella hominis]MRX81525.1 GntR family transcriptional regulator [Eggerthella guodeyinii]QOS68120.1 GntR family transcriptional regulator [Eggerthella guodeyinii]